MGHILDGEVLVDEWSIKLYLYNIHDLHNVGMSLEWARVHSAALEIVFFRSSDPVELWVVVDCGGFVGSQVRQIYVDVLGRVLLRVVRVKFLCGLMMVC